jgi:nucleotide-binding universal stress UspA family protein
MKMTLPNVDVKKILYATDLSENARFAFAYAVSLANLYGAKIVLLHVLPEVSELMEKHIVGYIDSDKWEEIKAHHFDEAREALIGKRKNHLAVQDVLHHFSKNAIQGEGAGTQEIIVERGNPVEEIINQSKKLNCDLIVMGTHGHGTLADAMIGSTARRVVRRSEIPVLVVRLPEEDD